MNIIKYFVQYECEINPIDTNASFAQYMHFLTMAFLLRMKNSLKMFFSFEYYVIVCNCIKVMNNMR